MAIELTDKEIAALLAEKKYLPEKWLDKLKKYTVEMAYKRSELNVITEVKNSYIIKLRVNSIDKLDFSVILCYEMPNKSKLFRLKRYNGKHEHKNRIEKNKFRDFHIHTATERYQELGAKEEHFAEISGDYNSIDSALLRMIDECNFVKPDSERVQISMELK